MVGLVEPIQTDPAIGRFGLQARNRQRAGLQAEAARHRAQGIHRLPVLRDLTGNYRTVGQERRDDTPNLRQKGTLP